MTTQPCPANCGRAQQPGKFLCLTCWRSLTDELRTLIWRTWREYNARDSWPYSPKRFLAAIRAYREAREACLKHLNERKETA